MILDARCRLDYLALEEVPAVFMLRPRSGKAQWIMGEEFNITPQVPVVEFTDVYGNLCQRLVMPVGEFRISVHFRVLVSHEVDEEPMAPLMLVQNLPPECLHFLLPSRYCQSDELSALARSIVGEMPPDYRQVAAIRNWVAQHLRYEPGASNSFTTALETLNTRCGVCRDFAHLAIALCRAVNVPARMVVGFLHGLEPMDLHAWFEAYIGGRWFTFDATRGGTSGNRVVVAYGRDGADVALATLFGNFSLLDMDVRVEAD